MEEWENLPDVGNIAGKNRKKSNLRDKFAPVPDSLLPRAQEEMATSLDAQVFIYTDDIGFYWYIGEPTFSAHCMVILTLTCFSQLNSPMDLQHPPPR